MRIGSWLRDGLLDAGDGAIHAEHRIRIEKVFDARVEEIGRLRHAVRIPRANSNSAISGGMLAAAARAAASSVRRGTENPALAGSWGDGFDWAGNGRRLRNCCVGAAQELIGGAHGNRLRAGRLRCHHLQRRYRRGRRPNRGAGDSGRTTRWRSRRGRRCPDEENRAAHGPPCQCG